MSGRFESADLAKGTSSPSLRGVRVALLESRMKTELASLVERCSGVPYCVPAVSETACDDLPEVGRTLDWLLAPAPPGARAAILSTGVGVEALARGADALERHADLLLGLTRVTTICRGPKPIAALKKLGVAPAVRVASPFTTDELLAALDALQPAPREALVLHYGERNVPLADALTARRILTHELSLYAWQMPADTTPLRRLVDEIVERRVGAVAFTSQVQARHLLQIADEMRCRSELLAALATHTPVAAIGPTCAGALRAMGVEPRVVPDPPKMGPMVLALARLVAQGAAQGRA
jgi:uroporphyrinogen-III synthase